MDDTSTTEDWRLSSSRSCLVSGSVLFCVCQSSVNWSVVCGSWCDSASSYFESVAFHHCRALVGVLFSAAKVIREMSRELCDSN